MDEPNADTIATVEHGSRAAGTGEPSAAVASAARRPGSSSARTR
ncbi:hypothetical protein FB470_005111 [Amycolatopsis thermophila]|uniref:Uncharacterized protein n=1 Tax=Amycolatopsis thermophila TaxID=206084 RepID=A0ABU0F0N2_9PSEU|nr:hypothetical protein [Amycolatopsis thermophila]